MQSGAMTRFSNKKDREPKVSAAKVGNLKAQRKRIGEMRKPSKVSTPTDHGKSRNI